MNAGSPPSRLAAAQPPTRDMGDGEPSEVNSAVSAVAAAFFGADEPEEDEPPQAQPRKVQQQPEFQGFGTLPTDGAFEAVDLGR